jgi:PHD/YefM family antitoxin component YafN of YafNO toxin-antitoxin module
MNNTHILSPQTYNTTDVRFQLGKILNELERLKKPVLIISRSKPKAWLYPYDEISSTEDLFKKWEKEALPKYQKIKAKQLISLIRQDRERI